MPAKGDKVLVINLNSIGQVREVTGNGKVKVVVGNININCDLDNLANPEILNKPKNKDNKSGMRNVRQGNSGSGVSITEDGVIQYAEINIIGQKVFDGILLVDDFVEQCIVRGDKHVRIVHGKGSGALGKGIQEHLRAQYYTKKYRYGGVYEGETGVTIVELK
jgi:DNA mismatch repair protein MutS2